MTAESALGERIQYDPFSQEMLDDPYPTFDAMPERAPVLRNDLPMLSNLQARSITRVAGALLFRAELHLAQRDVEVDAVTHPV
jgi:hypothetical protein